MKVAIYTSIALLAFAGNSILCRLALKDNAIDAASFTTLRLISGVCVLYAIAAFSKTPNTKATTGSWRAGFMLFIYAATFSYAYLLLDTGTGALILFGAVQISMILYSLASGGKLHIFEWVGLIVAFSGLCYLLTPGSNVPSWQGLALMSIAGIAWGLYTLEGKASQTPLQDTAYNFLRAAPFLLVLLPLMLHDMYLSATGIAAAVASGGIASGLGYSIWYAAVRELSSTQAAVLQLLVPIVASAGGIVLLGETLTLRLALASLLVLGGIFLVITAKKWISS